MNEYFDFFQNNYPPDIARYNRKWQKQNNFQQKAIRMTGKNSIIPNKDDNEEDEWPPIIGPIYDLHMKQLSAKKQRNKMYRAGENQFNLD